MKLNKVWFLSAALFVAFTFSTFAQEEMTKEEWQNQINKLNAQKESLQKETSTLKTDVTGLNTNLSTIQSYDNCMDDLYAMVGAKKSDIDNYNSAVSELEGKIRRKEGPKADRAKDLAALQANKISALPDFFNKVHNVLPGLLDAWVEAPTEASYTVVKGDCLWRIAKKKEFYGNGFAWPKIYQANRDQIKNPDLIFPKQIFKIPNLTEEEKSKYEKLKLNYKPAPTPAADPVTK
ncbi:MAG: LysM peptidoglycan-binding domain-containing protein [Ignavibacteria bacterium]|nr:LysM peptidoglycan-binding domain-containing protein [Ignavibacteria bacterium]